MTTPQILDSQMAERTNEELLEMFERREDWLPEALEAARIELQRRGIEIKPEEKEEEPRASRLLSFKSQAAIGIVPGIIMQFFGQALRDHGMGDSRPVHSLFLHLGLLALTADAWPFGGSTRQHTWKLTNATTTRRATTK